MITMGQSQAVGRDRDRPDREPVVDGHHRERDGEQVDREGPQDVEQARPHDVHPAPRRSPPPPARASALPRSVVGGTVGWVRFGSIWRRCSPRVAPRGGAHGCCSGAPRRQSRIEAVGCGVRLTPCICVSRVTRGVPHPPCQPPPGRRGARGLGEVLKRSLSIPSETSLQRQDLIPVERARAPQIGRTVWALSGRRAAPSAPRPGRCDRPPATKSSGWSGTSGATNQA